METCTTRGALLPSPLPFSSINSSFSKNPNFFFHSKKLSHFSGVVSNTSRKTLLRASSDETSRNFMEDKSDAVATFEEDDADNVIRLDKAAPVNVSLNEEDGIFNEAKQSTRSSSLSEVNESSDGDDDGDTLQPLKELLNKLNIELDVKDSSTYLLYGGSALVAVWFISAIVGAIDSIPVFPKLMEVVGLGYSLWFTTRYLLFKKNRDELGSKIEELKQEVLGSSNK